MDWEKIDLGFVALYGKDKINADNLTPSNYISTDNMLQNRGGITVSEYVPTVGRSSKFNSEDILVSNIRPYFKKIWFADCEGGCSNDVIVFKPDRKKVHPKFLYYQLSKDEFFDFMMAGANGTKMPRGNKASIPSFEFLLPSLSIQSKIASILSAYDDLIENNLKRIKLLEELAKRTYEEWFVKFRVNGKQLPIDKQTGVPSGWERKKISESCEVSGGGTPSRKKDEYWENGKFTWYSPTDLSKSKSLFQIDSSEKITSEGLKRSSAKLLQPNSFMMTSRATIGLFGLTDKPFCTNQGFINVTPFEIHHKEYLLYNFITRIEEFKGYATGATFPELSKSKFKALDIIWPEDNLLREFHKLSEVIHLQLSVLSKQNFLLRESRDILLPKLMSGKIDVSYLAQKEETKIIQLSTSTIDVGTKEKSVNWEFKEAVLIARLVEKFGSEKFPLGRFRYTKLSYLFHRHADNEISRYLRKAAGPYNPQTKYDGPEEIVLQKGYALKHKHGEYEGFVAGPQIAASHTHFRSYWSEDCLAWLEQFRKFTNDKLGLFATVDHSIIELKTKDQTVTVEAVKGIIRKEKEWEAKLKLEIFSDKNIQVAIKALSKLFD